MQVEHIASAGPLLGSKYLYRRPHCSPSISNSPKSATMLTTLLLSLAAIGTSSAAALSTRAPATFFRISSLEASDFAYPQYPESHRVNFTVSNPNAVYEQGGNMPSICMVEW